jgi:hypothetical protein
MAAAVPPMQKQVQQRTQEHQQKRQDAEDMSGVLGDEEERRNGQKRE